MAARSEFAGLVEDALQPVGPVRIRAMFGGFGVFLDDVMFGLIADDVLYLKVDDVNRPDFEAAGLEPFVYRAGGRDTTMSYRRAPDDLESWPRIERWAVGALDAARRARGASSGRGVSVRGRPAGDVTGAG